MLTNKENYIWTILEDMGIATSEELGLAIALCGKSEHTLNKVLFIRTGYRDIEQYLEEYDYEE